MVYYGFLKNKTFLFSIVFVVVVQILSHFGSNYSPCDITRILAFNPLFKEGTKEVNITSADIKRKLQSIQHAHKAYPPISPEELAQRQASVKKAYKLAWSSYKKFALGSDELKPITNSSHDWLGMALSFVDSIDTMILMELTEEYNFTRDWIAQNLDFDSNHKTVSVFETTIRVIGGLISAYDLTRDEMFLEKAIGIARKLMIAFDTPSGLCLGDVDLEKNTAQNSWCGPSSLVAVGSIQLEFSALSHFSNISEFANKSLKAYDILDDMPKFNGLYPVLVDPETATFVNSGGWGDKNPYVSLNAGGDSFYEYLLKMWILSGKKHELYRKMYDSATEAIIAQLVHFSTPSNLVFLIEKRGSEIFRKMDHLACFAGGMFALGAYHNATSDNDLHMLMGEELTHTCHELYARQATGIGPEVAWFPADAKDDFVVTTKSYLLRPETIESYFVLYWITNNSMYMEWGWEAFQAIQKYCATPNGYSGIRDVTTTKVKHDDIQQSFFLAETLKYLYLLFFPKRHSLFRYVGTQH